MDRNTKIAVVMGLYFLICTLAMVWPGAVVANRVEPMILGLPFFFFWYVLWVFMVFIGTVILYRWEQVRGGLQSLAGGYRRSADLAPGRPGGLEDAR